MPSGRRRDLAVSALSAVRFATVATVRISDKIPPTGVEPTVTDVDDAVSAQANVQG
jgi:hypothetical protein